MKVVHAALKNMACDRSKSADAEGGQFAPTRKACNNGIFTADRIKFAKWLTKMKNIAFKKWPVPAVKVPMSRVSRFREDVSRFRKL